MFYGNLPVTEADWAQLEGYTRTDRDDLPIDQPTLVGRWDYDWSSWYDEQDPDDPFGGVGSPVYESQLVGVDVSFTDKAMWYRTVDGEYVKGIPPNLGAYHNWSDGMSTENREGPKPGTASAEYLEANGGNYYWDEVRELRDVR
jgi:hypothetical protein